MSELKVNKISPRSGTTITLGDSGDAISVASGASFSGLTLSDNILFNTASKGIYLGVTSATASNLLDDYEEGTWTPTPTSITVNSGTPVYSGSYRKIGKLVYLRWAITGTFNITITADSSRLGSLPFSASTAVGNYSRVGTLNFIGGLLPSTSVCWFLTSLSSNTQALVGNAVYQVT
jgi:hypothetical protein